MRRTDWRKGSAIGWFGRSRCVWLSGLVLGVGLIGPSAALGAPNGNLTVNGKGTGVASTDLSTNPAPVTVTGVARISRLGEVVVLANDSLTPLGPGPVIPYTITGTETLIVSNGDQLFGTVSGTGVNNSGATSGTDVITITGGTGGFTGATGSYTETYTGHIFSQVGPSVVGPLHTTFRGQITLGGGYCDPLQGPSGYCDPLERSVARDHTAVHTHHQGHHRRRHRRRN